MNDKTVYLNENWEELFHSELNYVELHTEEYKYPKTGNDKRIRVASFDTESWFIFSPNFNGFLPFTEKSSPNAWNLINP